jgi:hypothetical protein
MPSIRLLEVHDPDEQCKNHCHWCGVDQPWPAWTWCFECGHGYRTEKDLVRAYRQGLLSGISRKSPWLRSSLYEMSVAAILWQAWRIKAGRIHFCPLCSHSF